jgi:hypothetical protein
MRGFLSCRQEMAKLKEDILQTVVRLIPEDLGVPPSGSMSPLARLSSGGSEQFSSDEGALAKRLSSGGRKNSPAIYRSGGSGKKDSEKDKDKAKKKEEKEKKRVEKEREKEEKKERRKSLSMLKRAGVEKRGALPFEV